MPTTQLAQLPTDPSPEEKGLLEAVVRDHVLSALGRPGGLNRVAVSRVWGDRYRVNVLVGADVSALTIAHSYFVEADGNGKILASSPAVTRLY